MTFVETIVADDILEQLASAPVETLQTFRVRPIMRQGTASSIPETWMRYTTIDRARKAIKQMYHDDRVLRVFIVTDDVAPHFVEWVDR